MKKRKKQQDKKTPLTKVVGIHSNILALIKNYEAFNLLDEAKSIPDKLTDKMELREIKLSSILLRMKAYRKLQQYQSAYKDADRLWNLMNPSEHKQNSTFKTDYVQELKILSDFEQEKASNQD
jgi:lipopolysaccharide biosynthesis regulator YciM